MHHLTAIKIKSLLALWVSLSVSGKLFSQEIKGSYWAVVLKDTSMIVIKDMQAVVDDTLWLYYEENKLRKIPVDSVATLIKVRKGTMGRGILLGITTGIITGAVIGATSSNNNDNSGSGFDIDYSGFNVVGGGLLGIIPGLLIGGTIGYLSKEDRVISLNTMNTKEKSEAIRKWCRSQAL